MYHSYTPLKQKLEANQSKPPQEKAAVPKFLRKVFHILEENKFNEYISWSDDGTAIIIKKPTEFAERVLPCYFKHNNNASFVRQLNMYSFKKKKNHHYDHVYSHEMFQRGNCDLLKNIRRKSAEGNQSLFLKVEDARFEREDFEDDVDIDTIRQENIQYKRVQKTFSTQLQFIERKLCSVKTEISDLHQKLQTQKEKENFMTRVLKILGGYYGAHSIQSAIEEAMIPGLNVSHQNSMETAASQPSSHNAFASQVKTPNTFDIGSINYAPFQTLCGPVVRSKEEEILNSELAEPADNSQKLNELARYGNGQERSEISLSDRERFTADQYYQLQCNLNAQESLSNLRYENQNDASKPQSYGNWHTELEKRFYTADKMLDTTLHNGEYKGSAFEPIFGSEAHKFAGAYF